jgi:outer membrane receptor protein involved in Fe transport
MSLKSLCLLSSGSLAVLAMAAPAVAIAQEPQVPVSLPAGPLQKSLVSLARQAGFKILFETELVAGLKAPSVQGRYTPHEALERLLVGTGIRVEQAGPGVVVLRAGRTQVSLTTPLEIGASEPTSVAPQFTEDTTMVAEIVVGSHIRGVKDTASPVIVLGREDMDRGGYASIAEALTSLPQAFGGTYSEDTAATGADRNAGNSVRGTGVDLRGLGADATLVLFNGKRMAGGGYYGDFTDIGSIPYAAVGRVEVLLDGASALYGADAVGGVVNIKLRTDLDGGETRASSATATRGGYSRYLFSQALGATWSGGRLLAAYEHTRNDALRGLDRSYTGYADLRPYGGTDRRRATYSMPANILRTNADGALVAAYAVPSGQDGVGLRPSDFTYGTVNYENQRSTFDVLPKSRRHSAVVSAAQDLGFIEFSSDLRFSQRKLVSRTSSPVANLVVTAANPFYVSPTGQASERIAYSFLNERGGAVNPAKSESYGVSLTADRKLGRGWNASLYGTYAQENAFSYLRNQINTTKLNEAAGLTADSPLSSFSAARDGYFNPFIGRGSNPAAVLDFILSGTDVSKQHSESKSANIAFDGPLFSLPGGPLRVAFGGQLRREEYRTSGSTYLTGYVETAKTRRPYSRDVRSAYLELNAPLVGPANDLPFIHRLELSVAGRVEDYDDVGSTRNPKFGLIWAPDEEFTFKASYGTSFRAPSLVEMGLPFVIGPTILPYNGGQMPVLLLQGGNPDLDPETANSWSAGLNYTPKAVPGLTLGLTAYRTEFKGRIGAPVLSSIALALSSPEFASFRTFVSPATNAADRARVLALVNDPNARGTTAYDINTYGAIVEARNVNTSSLEVEGLDATASYETTFRNDPLSLNASLSWIASYARKVTPTAQSTELSGQTNYPADLRARASATWTHGETALTAAVNHTGDLYAETGRRVSPWTTFDLQARWRPSILNLRGLSLTLNIQNAFDKAPPFYDNPLVLGYDPTNADPLGRMVTLQLTKAW